MDKEPYYIIDMKKAIVYAPVWLSKEEVLSLPKTEIACKSEATMEVYFKEAKRNKEEKHAS